MKLWLKVTITTLIVAVPALLLGPLIWPPHPANPVSSTAQLPLLIGLAVLEALTFGLGVAFIAYGLPLVRRLSGNSPAWCWCIPLNARSGRRSLSALQRKAMG
jgi:hypothetical protein